MKLNGKIQIVGGNPGSNKVLTCTDNRGNCEWLEIPSSGDDDFVDSGSLVGNTLVLTTVDGNIVEVDLSNLSSSGRPGNDGVGVFSTVDNGDGTFTITYTDESFFTTSDLTGPQGPKGDTGTAGSPGADGKNGTNGVDGAKGDTGDIGPAGPKGDAGIQGIQGPKGDTGTAGSSGANGKNGTDGSDGVGVTSTVNNGDGTFTINYSDGSTFTSSDLTGPAGNDGNASDTFLTSATLQGNSLLLGLNTGTDFNVDLSSLVGEDSVIDKFLSSAQIIQSSSETNSNGELQQRGDSTSTNILRLTMSDNTDIDVDLSDLVGTDSVDNNSLWFDKPTGNNIYRDIGNVGIGLDSPQRKLHIKGADGILRLETTESKGNNYFEYHDDTKIKGRIGYIDTKNDHLEIINDSNNGEIIFKTSSNISNLIIEDGGAGISNNGGAGTVPNFALNVSGGVHIIGTTGNTDSVITFYRDVDTINQPSGYIKHNVDENEYNIDLSYSTGINAPVNWTHKDINLSINDSTKLSIDGSDGKVSITDDLYIGGTVQINGGNPGSGKVLTSDGSGNATWQTPTGGSGSGGTDKYLDSVTLPVDINHPNVNQLTLLMEDGTPHSVDMSAFRNYPDTAQRALGVDDSTNQSPIVTTSSRQTVTVRHDLGVFYPVFTIYETTRGEVVLPFSIGVPSSTGSIPANNVTGPHTLNTIDITFTDIGTYIVKFVG